MTSAHGTQCVDPTLPASRELERGACPGVESRERMLEVAAVVFASRGLHGATTPVLAECAGVSEDLLYTRFESKGQLFRETVERSMTRWEQALDGQLRAIPYETLSQSLQRMSETTVNLSVSDATGTLLTHWALLEAPGCANDLYRQHAGIVRIIWERILAEHFPRSAALTTIQMRALPYTIQACLAFGFWLVALRHCPASAAPLVREFSEGIGRFASTLTEAVEEGRPNVTCG